MKENLIRCVKENIIFIEQEYLKENNFSISNGNDHSINLDKVVNIVDTGTISLFVKNGKFYFPKSADKIFYLMQFLPGYGITKNHSVYTFENLISNNNTFVTYIKHLFVNGRKTEDYYLDNVLHETMHFCGASGGTALEEGFTELKTRELALKYNLRTSGCGYPKEIKIALKLQSLFGKDICDELTFINPLDKKVVFLKNMLNEDMANLYLNVSLCMQEEFQAKYNKYKFPGITGPFKKALKYSAIDYNKAKQYIECFIKNKDNKLK